jgi:phosphoribosylformylglycinamidine synthase
MTPYEIMLSESQERMLLVAERGREREVLGVFAKWGLDAVEIGRVTEDGLLRVRSHGEVVAEIPAHPLAEEGPVYQRPMTPQVPQKGLPLVEFAKAGTDLTSNFRRLLASPAIASKRWVWEQYDHSVRTNTLVGPGAADAAVLRVKGAQRGLALATDGNGRWCYLNPRAGAMHAVCEAARNVACTGARPIAATNCLNFGSPEKPEVMWQFSEAIDGMAEACRALGTPITGGNVSFYNETLGRSIYPTPTVGVLGVLDDASRAVGMGFRRAGDVIVLLERQLTVDNRQLIAEMQISRPPRRTRDDMPMELLQQEFSSSEYAKAIHGIVAGEPPGCDVQAEKRLIECLVRLAAEGAIASAHDVSDGGLAVALAESCFVAQGSLGAQIELANVPAPVEFTLFGESGARAVVSCSAAGLTRVRTLAEEYNAAAREIGRVTSGDFRIAVNSVPVIARDVKLLREIWANTLQECVGA